MNKAIFVDTSLCTGCRACQVACKQWHDLPAEVTVNTGSFQNPQDLSFYTYKLVRMKEEVIDDHLYWMFFPDQCRHCINPPCLETAMDETAIYQDPVTGAVIYTPETEKLNSDYIITSCPYNIPRKASNRSLLAKCDMCNDRILNGLPPACVQTCPSGAMHFGNRTEIIKLAEKRLEIIRRKFPEATLLNPEDVNVIYLVVHKPELYWKYALASVNIEEINRQSAIKQIIHSISKVIKV